MFSTEFLPSRHSFAFPNTWHDVLLGALPVRGRCGGMAFAALDYFDAGQPVPLERELPAYDSELARLIWRRQIASVFVGLGYNLARFVELTYLPASNAVRKREIGRVLDRLAVGRPVPLGLINAFDLKHIGRNHQVLAYGAALEDGHATIRIYDPNYPMRDDVVLAMSLDGTGPVVERIGTREKPWRAMFAEKYTALPGDQRERPLEERAPGDAVMLGFGLVGFAVTLLALRWLFGRRR